MKETNAPISGLCHCAGIALHEVWDVDADKSYDIHWPKEKAAPIHPGSYTACYTLQGAGRLFLQDGPRIDLPPDSLLIVENEKIRRYCCFGDSWSFHWVEFSPSPAMVLPAGKRIDLPRFEMYSNTFYEIIRALRQPTPAHKKLAAATFTKLLYEWLVLCENNKTPKPHQETIQAIINEMHCRINDHWTVQAMASHAGMSEPNFRKCFRQVTGQSPKRFYNGIRMALAEALLNRGTYSVSEIAHRLGFTDPFHFSKAFKHHTGMPPSSVRKRCIKTDDLG